MRIFLLTIVFLIPLAVLAQTDTTMQKNNIEVLKAEAARKAAEAKAAAEKAQRAAEEALEAAKKAEQAAQEQGKAAKGWTIPAETPTKTKESKTPSTQKINEDEAYLAGAVPEVNGKVVFNERFALPGMTAAEVYQKTYSLLTAQTHDEHQASGSRIVLVNEDEHTIVGKYCEWLVFNNSLLSLDRTKFDYTLIAHCEDNAIALTLCRISYAYEENRSSGFKASAEELISDSVALNKKRTKLFKTNGKFRKKTIDRVNEIFKTLQTNLK